VHGSYKSCLITAGNSCNSQTAVKSTMFPHRNIHLDVSRWENPQSD
jgi:hypothetical protein